MFRYDNSGKLSQPNEKQIKRVSEIRKVTYVNYNPKTKKTKVTEGFETVREISCDPTIALSEPPIVVGSKTVEKEITNSNRRQARKMTKEEVKPE